MRDILSSTSDRCWQDDPPNHDPIFLKKQPKVLPVFMTEPSGDPEVIAALKKAVSDRRVAILNYCIFNT